MHSTHQKFWGPLMEPSLGLLWSGQRSFTQFAYTLIVLVAAVLWEVDLRRA
jgi:hypothetical protein